MERKEWEKEGDTSRGRGEAVSPTAVSNRLWAELLIGELVRQGVGLFVLSPGSRSTPLVLAVAASGALHVVHYDERGSAFCALGWARATGRPACWITTSGTAVANGLPAAVEADADGVPLVLLTADRPPELRESGANQTIHQPSLFAPYVRWRFDLPPPSADVAPAFVLTTAAQAVHRSLAPAGPVHLNAMFREPLVPADGVTVEGAGLQDALTRWPELRRWHRHDKPYTRYATTRPIPDDRAVSDLAARISDIDRGLVVLGKTDRPDVVDAAGRLAARLGWPMLPDIASGARIGQTDSHRIAHYDLALGSKRFRDAYGPQAVLYIEGRLTSKRLLAFLDSARPALYGVVRSDANRFDPTHRVTDRFQADPVAFCNTLCDRLATPSPDRPSLDRAWLDGWQRASEAIAHGLEHTLGEDGALSEPGVARSVSVGTPAHHGLVAAASMPIRDLDRFASGQGDVRRVTANRGASGIDGTVATAAGFARGLEAPVTLLIGDLALLHDLNSLALLQDGPPVTVVVVNNDGGGIFSFLSVAGQTEVFEPFFGTPHGLHFESAAQLFGLEYTCPGTAGAFEEAYRSAMRREVSSLIEVQTVREENKRLHDRLEQEALVAAEKALAL